jgi:ketosteroid isomerase-like protein
MTSQTTTNQNDTSNPAVRAEARSQEKRNIECVQRLYQAFGRGDVPAILELVSPDVHWEFGTPDHGIPWLREGRGREQVLAFFTTLAANLEFHGFEPLAILAEGDWVVGLIRLSATHKVTKKPLREECEAHVWRFDAAGRVIAMRHAADTASHLAAMTP